jgi:hypothetical protein
MLFLLGIGLRVTQYARNRSLWYDEAVLALNLVHRPFLQLGLPLDYHQGAPIGFLLLEKAIAKLAGYSEPVLRFLPLAAGIFALCVFFQVARLFLPRRAAGMALLLFSLSRPLTYYSSELKQYSTDVAVALILLWAMVELSKSDLGGGALLEFGVLGAAAIWLSHPASFILAGDGATLVCLMIARKDWPRLRRMVWIILAWSTSFAACYLVSLHPLSRDQALVDFWARAFPPRPLWSMGTGTWLIDTLFMEFRDLTLLLPLLGEALFVVGCFRLLRRDKLTFALLTAPLPFLFLAAVLHKYPLHGRLLLFLTPVVLMLVSEGAVRACQVVRRISPPWALLLLALVIAKPAWLAGRDLLHPDAGEDFKVALRYVQSHQHPGDVWYIYYGAKYQFAYYSELYKISPPNVQIGAECGRNALCYAADLQPLHGRARAWILLSHILIGKDWDEEQILRDQLDAMGQRLDVHRAPGTRAYLYDLSRPQKSILSP